MPKAHCTLGDPPVIKVPTAMAMSRTQRQEEFEDVRRVAFGYVAPLQFLGAQRIGTGGVELAGRARALHRCSQLRTQKEWFSMLSRNVPKTAKMA